MLCVSAVSLGCDLEKDTGDEALELTCADVPRLEAGTPPPAGESHVLYCLSVEVDATCPELSAVALEKLQPPHEDPLCGYEADPVCGPEAAIEDACCYEVMLIEWCQ